MASDQKTQSGELTDAERAARVRALLESDPPAIVQRSIEAFRRDLPELLNSHRGRWVAYRGDERIGIGKSQTDLYEVCRRLGLTRGEFIVCGIEEGVFDPDESLEASRDV